MPCYQIKLQILILAEQSLENSIVHSDSRSLATLLLIRDIQVHILWLLIGLFQLGFQSVTVWLFVFRYFDL